jgi:DNA invertase Pin-like site-specific DNA recombinase
MSKGKFVVYLRVSTRKQGKSGLGIEAQRQAVETFLNGGNWKVVKEFVEVESGKNGDRPQLAKALQACRVHGAKLCIAKLDRLSRDAHFLLGLEKAGVDFVCADMPGATRFTVGIMAMVADEERRMISERTKAALAAAKRRGVVLGGFRGHVIGAKEQKASAAVRSEAADTRASDLADVVKELQASGATSLRAIAAGLDARGIATAQGGCWSATQVMRLLARIARPFEVASAAA